MDAAAKIAHPLEPALLQQLDSLYPSRSHLADRHDLLAAVQLIQPPRELGQRNQVAADVRYLVFVFFTHVQQEQVLAAIETAFQLLSLNLVNAHFVFLPWALCKTRGVICCRKIKNPPASSSSGGGSM